MFWGSDVRTWPARYHAYWVRKTYRQAPFERRRLIDRAVLPWAIPLGLAVIWGLVFNPEGLTFKVVAVLVSVPLFAALLHSGWVVIFYGMRADRRRMQRAGKRKLGQRPGR